MKTSNFSPLSHFRSLQMPTLFQSPSYNISSLASAFFCFLSCNFFTFILRKGEGKLEVRLPRFFTSSFPFSALFERLPLKLVHMHVSGFMCCITQCRHAISAVRFLSQMFHRICAFFSVISSQPLVTDQLAHGLYS